MRDTSRGLRLHDNADTNELICNRELYYRDLTSHIFPPCVRASEDDFISELEDEAKRLDEELADLLDGEGDVLTF